MQWATRVPVVIALSLVATPRKVNGQTILGLIVNVSAVTGGPGGGWAGGLPDIKSRVRVVQRSALPLGMLAIRLASSV